MKVLIDTHLLVWLLVGDRRADKQVFDLMRDPAHEPLASVVSIWEVAIKWAVRRGSRSDMPFSGRIFAEALQEAGIATLDARPAHALAVDELPLLHGDPFDRLLLATARAERMTLLTGDAQLGQYGDGVQLV